MPEQIFTGEEVLIYDYGTFIAYVGTLEAICSLLRGNHHIKKIDFFFNGTDITAIEPR